MGDGEPHDEWEFVVPDDDAELVSELRRRGVRPGQRLRVRSASSGKASSRRPATTAPSGSVAVRASRRGRYDGSRTGGGTEKAAPAFFGSLRTGERDLAQRSQEILRSEFPGA
jgi:hypothetical protein